MQQDWNHVATISHVIGDLLGAASAKFLELGKPRRGQRVVDLGCGSGTFAYSASRAVAGDGGLVFGLDASPEMIRVAQHVNSQNPVAQFAVYDVHDGVADPETVDSIYCRFSMPFFTNPPAVLRGALEALKPGGRLCLMSIADPPHNDFISVARRTGSMWVDHVMNWGGEVAVANLLETNGFEQVLTKRIRALVTVNDVQEYWTAVRGLFGFADPQLPPALADMAPGTRLPISIVFALGRKHDPLAAVPYDIQSADDAIAIARRKCREVSPLSLSNMFKKETVTYLDVRPPHTRVNKIKDAVNVVRDDLEKTLPGLIPDAAANIVVYSKDGNQGALATVQLHAMGYTNVWNLQGGLDAWEYVGMKVVPA